MRARSLARRWALTPPFHPYPRGRCIFCATFRGSPRAVVSGHPALRSPDFPPRDGAIARPTPARSMLARQALRFARPELTALAPSIPALRSALVVEDPLTVRAKVNLEMFLNLVVELRRQTHPTSLAGPRLGQCDRQAGAPAEDH